MDAQQIIHTLLQLMRTRGASDLFLTVGFPPAIKIDGAISPVSNQKLSAVDLRELTRVTMNEKQWLDFEQQNESNFAISLSGIGRFRVNAFVQRGSYGLVIRSITQTIPNFEQLQLPPVLKEVAMAKRGLVIFVGGTGSGKSTSLAAMIDYRNEHAQDHIITVEDPIEYLHEHKKSIITQREIGIDTADWFSALKNTLRQAPNVILIGEVRDRETMEHALMFAETGHLCLTTLHANSTNQAIERIVNFFPKEAHHHLLADLSTNIRAFVSQRLVPHISGSGRVAAIEVLLHSPLIADLIGKGQVSEIKELMGRSRELGMQTFDQSLFDLAEKGLISLDEALLNADSVNDLRLRFKLEGKASQNRDVSSGIQHLDII
ncbi:MAG: PilT/PilU family type 4a pilus ATPase [Betaproteobacteria bacterium]|nr:PilT/PilU family type 4a pilus ATPase [Betaproteobacteria bacterium]